MKIARVVPLHIKNYKTDPGNYRPVSILSVVPKILERVVYNQIESYMTSPQKNTIYSQAFVVLIQPTDHIRFQMSKGFYTGMVMIDLQKASDTVDHGILLRKLKALGFHDLSVSWLESYLANRNQKTEINGITISGWFSAGYHRDPF